MYPRNFSHIGISVTDINKAVDFYSKVMNWYIIMPVTLVKEEKNTAIGQMCIDVFGEGFKEFKIAHMSTGDRIGFELFEFSQTPKERAVFHPYQPSVFHFCVQDPNIEELAKK